MKVWVALHYTIEWCDVVAIFSSKESAQDYESKHSSEFSCLKIEEWQVQE